jgi:hypothetical protein
MINPKTGAEITPEADSEIFYGFVIAIAAFFILFSAYGVRFAYGIFFKPEP